MTSADIRQPPHADWIPVAGGALQKTMCIAGIVSSVVYVGFDLVSAARYPGYSLMNQAISELSAIGAPTAGLWAWLGPIYAVLFTSFAIGVVHVGRGNRALRLTGWIMLAFVAWGMLWPFFPMHERGTVPVATDIGHFVVGAGSSVLILGFIGAGAFAFGRRFRAWSLTTAFVYLVTSIGTFLYVPLVEPGAPTPWLGVVERVMIYSYLLWIAVLGGALLRNGSSGAVATDAPYHGLRGRSNRAR